MWMTNQEQGNQVTVKSWKPSRYILKQDKSAHTHHFYSMKYWKLYPYQSEKKKKRYLNLKGKGKIFTICRWHDTLYRES